MLSHQQLIEPIQAVFFCTGSCSSALVLVATLEPYIQPDPTVGLETLLALWMDPDFLKPRWQTRKIFLLAQVLGRGHVGTSDTTCTPLALALAACRMPATFQQHCCILALYGNSCFANLSLAPKTAHSREHHDRDSGFAWRMQPALCRRMLASWDLCCC